MLDADWFSTRPAVSDQTPYQRHWTSRDENLQGNAERNAIEPDFQAYGVLEEHSGTALLLRATREQPLHAHARPVS
jgi:hypothetical protein